jgi:hypothetical protein
MPESTLEVSTPINSRKNSNLHQKCDPPLKSDLIEMRGNQIEVSVLRVVGEKRLILQENSYKLSN